MNLANRVDSILKDGLVVNLTDIVIPDGALLFLSKGNSFIPATPVSKHDIVYDTNEFLRKLHWRTFFNTIENEDTNANNTNIEKNTHPKLRLPSHNWPNIKNKVLDSVCDKVKNLVNSLDTTKFHKYKNLSYLERKGLLWCIKMKNTNKIHFSQADKGGATVLMDPDKVHQTILSDLNNQVKYMLLQSDPRSNIEKNLLAICQTNLENKGLSEHELFLITGNTGKGKSHNPLFRAGKPNPFPLFKLHSASPEDVVNKITPPHRLVTSMKYGPTKRPAVFIDSILTPISVAYCGREYVKDTPDFLNKLHSVEAQLCSPGVSLFTLDVKALYPSINTNLLPDAVDSAISTVADFSPSRKLFILDLVKFNVKNAVTHYRGDWFKALMGIPTGASDSVCLANIYMKWVLIKFFSKHPAYRKFFVVQMRFIDDLFGGWEGTQRQFSNFINCFNSFGKEFGIYFDKEQFGDTVNFLDVSVSNSTGVIVTDLYSKPTDAHRYLHRSSFHPIHTFSGIPFSQMRRAVVICSTPYLRDFAINNMISYFIKCGYKKETLQVAKDKALLLNRADMLLLHATPSSNDDDNNQPLCFVLPYNVDTPKIKSLVNSLVDDIERLTGTRKVIFSQKRNPNTSSLLFNKYGFAQEQEVLSSQRCNSVNCSSCDLKVNNFASIQLTPNFSITPSKKTNCKSSNIIYAAICKLCVDFYFGKTMNEEHIRMNGHRDKFTMERFDKSALAMHIYTDHPEHVGSCPEDGLSNFNIVILQQTTPVNLHRRESFYIWSTEADIRHLNRYKVI